MSEVSFMRFTAELIGRPSGPTPRPVLVIVAEASLRAAILEVCREAGVPARGVGSIADLEHWPDGQMVITDVEHVTPFWRSVGAVEVVAVVRSGAEGLAALERGATGWLHLPLTRAAVAAIVATEQGCAQGTA